MSCNLRAVLHLLVFTAALYGSVPVHAEADGSSDENISEGSPTVVTLADAIQRALNGHPRLFAFASEIDAAGARRTQARLRPNPELEFEIEEARFGSGSGATTVLRDAGGTIQERSVEDGADAGLGEAEITLSVSQRIELGGKRSRRIALANEGSQVAHWDYEIARADVILETRRAFVTLLAAQERVQLRQRLQTLASQTAGAVQARADAGKVSPLQSNQAAIELAQTGIQLDQAERRIEAARYQLASLWGAQEVSFQRVAGDLMALGVLPDRDELLSRAQTNPDTQRWTAEITRREAAIGVEKSARISDLTVTLGWRSAGLDGNGVRTFDSGGTLVSTSTTQFGDNRENSFVLGFSIPLPLFNRNQGRIREAEHLLAKAGHERRATELETLRTLSGLHEGLAAIRNEADVLRTEIIPKATETFEATQLGFEQGKFSYLDVLSTQRTLFGVQNQYLESLEAYHVGVAEMERFLGQPVDDTE